MIRLYKQNGSIVVDGRHKNVALVEKFTWQTNSSNNSAFVMSMVSFNKQGVVVVPLTNGINTAIAPWAVLQQAITAQNKPRFATDKSVGKPYHSVLYGGGTSINTDFYVFGDPAEATPTGKAGFRVYSEVDGGLIFDSRLPYLKIIGMCQNGMVLDPSKRYGLLYGDSVLVTYRDSGESWNPTRSVSAVHFWWQSSGRLTSGWTGRHYEPIPPILYPPLLVDLTGL